jgi:CubicO group peptidase (beta-lactamase class C family)
MATYKIASAEIAIAYKGKIIAGFDEGWKASEPHPVASLSKAITGVCAAKLIDARKLAFGDTLGKVLADYFKKNGDPKDARFKAITVEQLLTHQSGLAKNVFDDAKDKSIEQSMATATTKALDADPGTAVAYSDTGYLILGYVIQSVSHMRYEDYCQKTLLSPLGAKASIDPTLKARAPNGGWSISAQDYAKFLFALDSSSNTLGDATRTWLDNRPSDPRYTTGPCPRFKTAPSYGFGFCQHKHGDTPSYYHDGLLHHNKYYPKTGGSFFYVNKDHYAVAVIFSGENPGNAYAALENSVIAAMTANSGPKLELAKSKDKPATAPHP